MATSKRRKAALAARWSNPEWQKSIYDQAQSERSDPFSHSTLNYWLNLELWDEREGLLILSGVDPNSVGAEGADPWANDLSWRAVQPFREPPSFSLAPVDAFTVGPESFKDAGAYESYLQDQEYRYEVAKAYRLTFEGLQHKLARTINPLGPEVANRRRRPVAFLAWAKALNFVPEWLEWAAHQRLIPDQLDPTPGPFFDADSPEYPRLLHIAVRAWDAARLPGKGTPKQRIDQFLQERYPDLSPSTRSAIALIANWQKAGGRPPKSKEQV